MVTTEKPKNTPAQNEADSLPTIVDDLTDAYEEVTNSLDDIAAQVRAQFEYRPVPAAEFESVTAELRELTDRWLAGEISDDDHGDRTAEALTKVWRCEIAELKSGGPLERLHGRKVLADHKVERDRMLDGWQTVTDMCRKYYDGPLGKNVSKVRQAFFRARVLFDRGENTADDLGRPHVTGLPRNEV